MTLSTYPKYKDSGVDWIGEVPSDWNVLPNRSLFYEVKNPNHPDEQLLSVTISRGVISQIDLLNNTSKKDSSNVDKSKYKLVKPGDIVYNKMRAWQGALGISRYKGIVSPAYIIQRPRNEIVDLYFHYLFRTPLFCKEAEKWSYGITSDQWSLRAEHFKLIYSPVPSKEEQVLIARYLTHINNKIQKYISAKRKLIKLLEEQKQAIIHQAVTGAINVNTGKPFLKYRSVDNEWIDRIPDDWKINKIKYISKINPSIKVQSIQNNVEVSFVPMENVDEKLGTIDRYSSRKYSEVSKGYTSFNTGDIIFAKITPCMENGNCAVVGDVPFRLAFGSTEFIVIRPNTKLINTEFLHFLLRDKYFRIICESNMKGSAGQKRISSDFIGNYLIALPSKDEQKSIIKYTEESNEKIDLGIIRAKKEIALLMEYRTRIIADVVTGKVDVRKVANTLPEELEVVDEFDNSEEEILEEVPEVDENESN